MASVTFAIPDKTKEEMKSLIWVNWSELTREETLKKDILDRFIKIGTLSKEDQEFCDKMGWYPIDELELREGYIEKIKKIEEGSHSRMNLKELNKLIGLE